MATSNIKLFDENKGNMLNDTEFNISTQRLNGLQTGVASSQLQNKAMYQASLVAYAIAQVMMQNGMNANDTDAVSAFVANLSGTLLQKVHDIATTSEAQAAVATGKWMSPALTKAFFDYRKATTAEAQEGVNDVKWMSPALVKAAIDVLAAKAQNVLSDATKALYGLETTATPDDLFLKLILPNGKFGFKLTFKLANGSTASGFAFNENTLHPLANSSLVADSNGIIFCYADSQSVSATFGTDYFGIVEQTVQLTADTTKPFTPVTITLANDQSLADTILQTSKTYKLIGNVDEADFCAVGGGGGGGQFDGPITGGGGGYVKSVFSVKFDGKNTLKLAVGGGGSGGSYGSDGGSTSVSFEDTVIVSAAGGKSGKNGGAGNGNGGNNSAGTDGTVRVFNDSSLPLPGGGGGSGNYAGGKDFGGRGNPNSSSPAQSGRGPGGGGGGCNIGPAYGASAGSGANGAVYVRVRYKQ